jgi:hypothetical protein
MPGRGISPAASARAGVTLRPGEFRDQRAAVLRVQIQDVYEPILRTLGLAPGRLLRLKELLVERQQSAEDVEEFAKDQRLGPAGAALALAEAEAPADQEIAELAGGQNAVKVQQMLAVSPQLAEIHNGVGADLAFIGLPLEGDQALGLARIFQEVYAKPPAAGDLPNRRTDGFDPISGLAAADREALALAAPLLSPDQSRVLQSHLAAATVRYSLAGQ